MALTSIFLATAAVAVGTVSVGPPKAVETAESWTCNYRNVPDKFPAKIRFIVHKDYAGNDEIIEYAHLPYKVLENNRLAIVAVSSNAEFGGRFVGPAAHQIEQEFVGNDVRWKNILISAETLEISRTTGDSVIATVRLDGSPVLPIRGKCLLDQ